MSDQPIPDLSPAPEPAPKSGSPLKIILIVLGLIGCGGGLIVGGCGLLAWGVYEKTGPYRERTSEHNAAISAGDWDGAYAMMSPNYRTEVNIGAFRQFFEDHKDVFPGTFTMSGVAAATGKNTTVTGQIVGPGGGHTLTYEFLTGSVPTQITRISIQGGQQTPGYGFALDETCEVGKAEVTDTRVTFPVKVGSTGFAIGPGDRPNVELWAKLVDPKGKVIIAQRKLVTLDKPLPRSRVSWTVTLHVPKPLAPEPYTLHVRLVDSVATKTITHEYPLTLKQR